MQLFPNPKQLPNQYARRAALSAIGDVALAAQGAFDEIRDRAQGLNDLERRYTHLMAAAMSECVREVEEMLGRIDEK